MDVERRVASSCGVGVRSELAVSSTTVSSAAGAGRGAGLGGTTRVAGAAGDTFGAGECSPDPPNFGRTVGTSLTVSMVFFGPRTRLNIAVLDVPGVTAPALRFADEPAATGTDAIALGFPEAGPFNASSLRVRDVINLSGPNIYRSGQVLREVYTVRGSIRQGNSGGPMINTDGEVLGVVFGAAEDPNEQTGFVLTAKQVEQDFAASENRSARVSTQTCVSP